MERCGLASRMLHNHHPYTFGVCSANYKCIGGQIDSACSAGVHPVRLKVVVFMLEIDLLLICLLYIEGGEHRLYTKTLEQSHYLLTLIFIMICSRKYKKIL